MKNYLNTLHFRSVVLGSIAGFFVSMFVFSALVPSGPDMIRAYNMKRFYNMRNGGVDIDKKVTQTASTTLKK